MRHPLLRPILVIEFLLALQASFTLWSQVGGQYHLALVFWPWKLVIGLAAATLVVGMTATLVQNDGAISRRLLVLALMLVAVMLAAGALSYDAHLNEPVDDDRDDEPGSTTVKLHQARERSEPGASPDLDVTRSRNHKRRQGAEEDTVTKRITGGYEGRSLKRH